MHSAHFANDFDNLWVVDDSTNQSKSDQAPHEWLPPNKGYWCECGKRWGHVKDKYGLRYSDWVYRLPDGTLIVIPAGFIFDGASMPKPLWGILSPVGLLLMQGLVHDFGYRYDYLWAVDRFGNFYRYKENAGQKYWDSLFKGVGLDVNDMIVVDQIAWAMLRLFGCLGWRNNRKLKSPEIMPTTYL